MLQGSVASLPAPSDFQKDWQEGGSGRGDLWRCDTVRESRRLMNGWARGHRALVAKSRVLLAPGVLPGVDEVPWQVRIATRADAIFEERH